MNVNEVTEDMKARSRTKKNVYAMEVA